MKIGIELNDTLRSFSTQLQEVINKYHYKDFDIEKKPIRGSFWEYFEFDNEKDFNTFIYEEAGLELFGHPDVMDEGSVPTFNITNAIVEEYEEDELIIVGREAAMAIPGTLFFLSKIGSRVRKIIFVNKYSDIWHHVDVMVTTNPTILKDKPKYKQTIKIKTSYNEDLDATYTAESLNEVLNNLENSEGFFEK